MNTKINLKESTKNLIISAAYGDTTIINRIYAALLRIFSREAASLYSAYRKTYKLVKTIKQDECKEYIINNVYERINLNRDNRRTVLGDFYLLFAGKPLAAFAVTLTVIALMLSPLFLDFNKDYNGYSREEVKEAEEEVKQSFALIGRVLNKTQNIIENEVIKDRVAKPVNQGINIINNIFIEGAQNEKTN